ncbi:hypothetical protein FGO68_gene16293 [Halteria grandinella]|uniref:Uncharacterized protein n=1 Tax=Halteria grandinella TaxID=5974 RepID=A0A8J8P5C9_HALGN|nr:hypothetical protein FGO68_gene16293 [Halteria grandinella]
MGLKHFFHFLGYIEKLDSITLNFMTIHNYYDIPDNPIRGLIVKNNTTFYNYILFQVKQYSKKLAFTNCHLVGNFTTHFPKIYLSIESLLYQSSNLLDTGEYGKFQNLIELRIVNCNVVRMPKIDEDQKFCQQVCQGVNIQMIYKLIGSDDSSQTSQTLKTLEADLYVGEDLKPDNNHPWKLITSIYDCKLRDHLTKFSFSMIYIFLRSSDPSDFSLPPIFLEISGFRQKLPNTYKAPMPWEDTLRVMTDENGLTIYGYEEVCTIAGSMMIVMQIKLKDVEGRRLTLKFKNGLKLC